MNRGGGYDDYGAEIKAWKAGGLPTTEVPHEESKLMAPAEFLATKEERHAIREWEAGRREHVGGGRR